MLPTCEDLGIGFVPFSPLGKGFLTGRFDTNSTFNDNDIRTVIPRFTSEALEANQAVVKLVQNVAERKNTTPARIALAWLLAQKPWIVPIPGTRKLERMDENFGAVDVDLTDNNDLQEINMAASKIEIVGARYPEFLENQTGL